MSKNSKESLTKQGTVCPKIHQFLRNSQRFRLLKLRRTITYIVGKSAVVSALYGKRHEIHWWSPTLVGRLHAAAATTWVVAGFPDGRPTSDVAHGGGLHVALSCYSDSFRLISAVFLGVAQIAPARLGLEGGCTLFFGAEGFISCISAERIRGISERCRGA